MNISKWYADEDNILTIAEAAKLMDMSPQNLYNYVVRGRGPTYFKFKGHTYFYRDDVIKWSPAHLRNGKMRK